MMKFFITGATGFIGMALARRLAAEGHSVNVLARSPEKAKDLNTDGISVFKGDITDVRSIEKAMKGCTHVFHLAAYAKPTAKDLSVFHEVNVEGTRKILEACVKLGIERVVFTSTAGTFDITGPENEANESSKRPENYYTEYAKTKRQAELLCVEYIEKGLDIITVFPTRVFGPGILNESNSLTKIASRFQKGKWRIIPGNGKTYGNYVFVNDVVNGLIMAMNRACKGESYILGGENATFNELFNTIKMASGKKYRLFNIPYPVLWFASVIMKVSGIVLRKPAALSPAWVKRYLQNRRLSSQKAEKELGYTITPLFKGFEKTYTWLRTGKTDVLSNPDKYYTVITGASSGIGRALAMECAQKGMNLLLVSLPNTGLPEFASELEQYFEISVKFQEINLCDNNAQTKVLHFTNENKLKVNCLINNVGVGFNGQFEAMPAEKITQMFMLNMLTTTLMTQLFVPILRQAPRGYILNMGSLAAFSALPGKSIYAASKAYVMYLTRALASELKGSNLSVTGVFPAGVPTNHLVKNRLDKGTILARSLTTSMEEVARCSIDGMLKGKEIVFPGRKLKTFYHTAAFLPQGLILYFATREFRRSPDH
jgi:NAD+-dependent farnesol dehydrogenase